MPKRHNSHPGDPSAPAGESAVTTLPEPGVSDPQPNGEQPIPQPATTVRRKKRDPNAIRPTYLLVARHRDTAAVRVLIEEPTIGRARFMAPRLASLVERDEIGPVIVRAKLVS